MAKKVKKKAKSGQKEKPGSSHSAGDTGISGNELEDKGLCSHIDTGINLEKLSDKLGSLESPTCEDCRGDVDDRRAKKGKGKKGGVHSKSESKAIWICLECGHFSCGGVGLPTTPQSHAVRHSKQNRHPLVVHYQSQQQLWCFPCNKLISTEKSEGGKHKEALDEVVYLLKGQPGKKSNVDVEDVWFGSGSVTSAIKSDYSKSSCPDGSAGYSVRGLVNLGNTCFFNSIMQNLLALNRLRDYFFKFDESVGPLSAALRKLFLETGAETSGKNPMNPRSLFGSLCSKAPQFKGYHQHDSHELLRCLLDGLSTEELNSKKHIKSSQDSVTSATFVDAVFGGQLSSTVCCVECRHSSTIYEPILDLSLPVPMKKPPSKKIPPVSRSKKPKLPPRKSGRTLSKLRKEAVTSKGGSFNQSTSNYSSDEVQSIVQPAEIPVLPSFDTPSSDATDLDTLAFDMGLTSDGLSAIQKPRDQQPVENFAGQAICDESSWMDYLGPNTVSDDMDVAPETDEVSDVQDFGYENIRENDISLPTILDSAAKANLLNSVSATSSDSAKQSNAPEPGILAQKPNACQQFRDKENVDSHVIDELTPVSSSTEDVFQNADVGDSFHSCNQVCLEDSVTSGNHNENPSQVQDSKVMLPPDKENASFVVEDLREESASFVAEDSREEIEVSSKVTSDEKDSLDFVGLGDLFDEPEATVELKPSDQVFEGSDNIRNGIIGNSSDSEPNEVDDANAPVSVESCMALFTKPELLSKDEHAWQCDNCSEILREKRTKASRRKEIPRSEFVPNGSEDKNQIGLVDIGKTYHGVNSANGTVEKDVVGDSDERSLPQNKENYGNGNSMLEQHPGTGIHEFCYHSENTKPRMIDASELSSSNGDGSAESDLLSAKSEPEVHDQGEVNTENLKVKRDATKSILITKAPSILTIHLKRFSQDARGRLSKLNGHVNFRETIDLKPYMDPRCSDKDGLIYCLVGVVEHSGSMRGGHYVAYVRGTKSWYHASDTYVRVASLQEVLNSEAYILFYERT